MILLFKEVIGLALTTIGLLGIVALLVLLFLGMNVGFTMVAVGFVGYIAATTPAAALGILKTIPFSTVANFNLSVIPLFVLMGQFCFHSGISTGLYNACYKWLSRLNGGLAVATIGASALFAALSGSSPACAATMGTVCLPEMRRYGYKNTLSTGCLAAGGTLGILIPPSVGFILYGVATSNSIGALFAAGLIPGIVLTLFYVAAILLICKMDPKAGPKGEKFTWPEKFKALSEVLPMIILFIVVIGGIFAGLFTANEGAAVGAFGSFVFLVLNKRLTMKTLRAALFGTIKTSCMIYLILIGGHVFANFMAITRLPAVMAGSVASLNVNNYVILILILLIYIALGFVMDSLAMLLILMPIFYPLITGMGMNPIWFGVLMVMCMETGQITPPVGINVYVIYGIARDIPMQTIFKGVMPFFLALMIAIVVMILFPGLSLTLPNLLYS